MQLSAWIGFSLSLNGTKMTKITWARTAVIAATAVLWFSGVAYAASTPSVGSREFKVLLNPTAFSSDPKSAAASFLTDLKASLASNGFDETISKSFSADHDRIVTYYDTAGTCYLNQLGYSMRKRDESGDLDIELKFGSTNQSTAASTDVSGSKSSATSKLEDDITPVYTEKFSHSTTETLSSSKYINKVSDIKDLFPKTTAFDTASSDALVAVSGLSIHEITYDGPTSDLGQEAADFTLTLWYPNGATTPALAEISFDVDVNDDGVFTTKVTSRSQLIFSTIQEMTNWTQTPSSTKTAWVYKYQPSFCSQ